MYLNLLTNSSYFNQKQLTAHISKSRATLFGITVLISLIAYLLTLAPSITWRNSSFDSGDFATAIAVNGVPHPPGFPTYLILGELFQYVPFGDIAYRLNLLSATCTALTIGLLALIIYKILTVGGRFAPKKPDPLKNQTLIWLCAFAASLTFAFSSMLWSQAVITEVYALNILFAASMFYTALSVKPGNGNWLIPLLFLLLGLSLGNHLSITLMFPLTLWLLLRVKWHGRLIVTACLAFILGLSVYLIIPLRAAADPPVNWGTASTWSGFWWLVSAQPYRKFLFTLPWELIQPRFVSELTLLTQGFMWWGVPVGLLGFQRLVRLDRSLAYGSLITFLLFSVYSIGYNTTDSYVYLLPSLLIFAVWIGSGLHDLGQTLLEMTNFKRRYAYIASWGLIFLPVLSLCLNFSEQNLSNDDEAYIYAQKSLQLVADNAIIITNDDVGTFALWYGSYGLGWRSDVATININLLPYAWYRQVLHQTHPHVRLTDSNQGAITTFPGLVDLNLATTPIYLATRQPLDLTGYHLESVDHLQRVVKLSSIANQNLNK
jgi:hypothetical protein